MSKHPRNSMRSSAHHWTLSSAIAGLFLLISQPIGAHAAEASDTVSFNRQIQPILSEYCYHCHGPDSATRKPKKQPLRLDREQFAFEPRDGGKPVMIKGDPKASELVKRVLSKDEDEVMPPPSEHKQLKAEEKALLETWIAQGARYEAHWAFIAPSRPTVPPDATRWSKNPIDNFVLGKLHENYLTPNSEESKARLFRRLSFDLTGLPPSPAELKSFLKDGSARAYEKAVDRMLASTASAEQFARHWLDAVRYADTQGIHHDHSRIIWPYRDWVINAFKKNQPFDQFTIEQLAGDLLPSATLDQKIASGYNRLLPTTGEGGALEEEYKAIYAKDRVDTTGAVWLGLTTGCATCHDHKFDPTSTKDFYSLTAFFRNSTVRTLDNGDDGNTPPLAFVPRDEDRPRWPVLETNIAKAKAGIQDYQRAARPAFEQWLANLELHSPKPISTNRLALQLPLISATNSLKGPFGNAQEIADSTIIRTNGFAFTKPGKFSYGAFIQVGGKPNGALLSRMNKAEGYRGWDLFLSEGKPTVHIVDQYPDTALKVTAKDALKPGRWHHIAAVYDGSQKGAAALTIYVDGIKASVDVNYDKLGTNLVAKAPVRLGARSDNTGISDPIKNGKVFLQDLRIYERALSPIEAAQWAATGLFRDFATTTGTNRTDELKESAHRLYLAGNDTKYQKLQANLEQLQTERSLLRARGATTLVMEEKKDSVATANVLTRGNYASKGATVTANTPAFLPAMASDAPHNRLGLARWIVSKENPLTARVTVNRVWSQFFGYGIVETTEDFGVMGARPVNPELLDWLAVDFRDSGWDFRHLIKTIVTSATYRQSAAITPEKLEKDPLNKLISRGPHYRLDAEQIRDQALAASGLLVPKVGGPPVKPYQPEGVWETVAMKVSNTSVYKQDAGDALYRRSMYTFWKRIAPPASMEILNAPSRETFCTRRERSDTPLQAFVTMNDPQFLEAARQLAALALKSSPDFDRRLDQVTERLLARRLTDAERATVRKLQQSALDKFEHDSTAARALIGIGESKADPTCRPAELAAWTLVASEVMNLDESLTK